MAKLSNINVVHAPGRVAMSMTFEDAPDVHYVLPLKIAQALLDKLGRACQFAAASAPGDSIGVSDAATVKILPPKGH